MLLIIYPPTLEGCAVLAVWLRKWQQTFLFVVHNFLFHSQ